MFKKLFYYPAPFWRLYAAFGFGVLILSVLIWGPFVLLLILLRAPRKVQSWGIRQWFVFALWIFRLRVRVHGPNHFHASQPTLLVSNHQSHFDIPTIFHVFPAEIRMVAKKELFSIPIFGQVMKHGDFISVERGNRRSGNAASEEIRKKIRSGIHVWVAPEGTRSKTKQMGAFKKGAFAVAIDAQVPVQPLLIYNSLEACPSGSIMVRIGSVIDVEILPQISTQGLNVDERGELCAEVKTQMEAKMLQGPPPNFR